MSPTLPAPQLTVYRTGLVNLNVEATQLLRRAKAIRLLAPTTPGTHWQLLPRKDALAGYVLCGRPDRGNVRFRAAPLAAALFAAFPPEFAGPLYLQLKPDTLEAEYDLVALHSAVQPNLQAAA
jgi:hypothetical protein